MTVKETLIRLFEENKGHYISGEEIAQELHCSRTAVWKAVNQLKEDGYEIEAVKNKGYMLSLESDVLSEQAISRYLEHAYPVSVFQEITSTNDVLKKLAVSEHVPEGTTVISDYQTGGKGRLGRSFFSPKGTGLYISMLLRPEGTVMDNLMLTAQSAVVFDHLDRTAQAIGTIRRVILPRKRFLDVDDRVDAEAGEPLVEPPVDHRIDFLAQLRIFPVEIRLLLMEHMEVALVRMPRKRFPDTAAEVGAPVARNLSARAVLDVEVLPVFTLRILAGLSEPRMLIRAVVDDEIHQDVHIALFRFRDQPVHVLHRTEARVNVVVIRDIIALIGERRAVDRLEPEDIDAEILQIIELIDDARKIADAVPVRITEALRIDLIRRFRVPPLFLHSKYLPPRKIYTVDYISRTQKKRI